MKILNIILVLLIGMSCNNSGSDEEIGVEIHIQYLFQDDIVNIEIDGDEIFNEAVTSDPVLSLAHILQVELDSGDHLITVKMSDESITEPFSLNDKMIIAVIYSWMEDELQLVYYEDGERPLYD
jgi:hypothetical protein